MELTRLEGEESVNPVRSKESRGTCKPNKGRSDGSAGSMVYSENFRQEAHLREISGSMNH